MCSGGGAGRGGGGGLGLLPGTAGHKVAHPFLEGHLNGLEEGKKGIIEPEFDKVWVSLKIVKIKLHV